MAIMLRIRRILFPGGSSASGGGGGDPPEGYTPTYHYLGF